MAVPDSFQTAGNARPPYPPSVQTGLVKGKVSYLEEAPRTGQPCLSVNASPQQPCGRPALRLCKHLAWRVRSCVYESVAWKLLSGVGAPRPDVPALAGLAYWPQEVPEVPRVPEWLAAGELGPPSWDMVPACGCVALRVSRPKVLRALEVDSQQTGRPVSLAEVLNERADRIGVVAEDRGMRPRDQLHVWATVWTLWARTEESLRVELQGVLNERWGRNHVGKVRVVRG